jgi:hypothetical protein
MLVRGRGCHSGELPVSLSGSGPIANPTTRHLDFCSLVLSQLKQVAIDRGVPTP